MVAPTRVQQQLVNSTARGRLKARVLVGRLGHRLGYSVIRDGPLSPIPDVPPADNPVWTRRSSMAGIPLDLDAQLAFVEERLAPHFKEFRDDVRGGGFELWNSLFQAGDAEVLYALMRYLKPRRVLEIGSGNSTLVTAAAAVANGREGSPTELVAVDPFPTIALTENIEGLERLERIDCRELPLERFQELEPGDVLFIDTLHIVKLGSEVNWLILEVLPRLKPGVWVHFHDIFLPYEYPWYFYVTAAYATEQYLLQAFLIDSPWRIELALAALFLDRHDRLVELIPSLADKVPGVPALETWLPVSMWIRREQ